MREKGVEMMRGKKCKERERDGGGLGGKKCKERERDGGGLGPTGARGEGWPFRFLGADSLFMIGIGVVLYERGHLADKTDVTREILNEHTTS